MDAIRSLARNLWLLAATHLLHVVVAVGSIVVLTFAGQSILSDVGSPISERLAGGVLGLIVSSALIGTKALRFVGRDWTDAQRHRNRSEWYGVRPIPLDQTARVFDADVMAMYMLSQYGLYLMILIVLWLSHLIGGQSNTWVALTSWMFFFIADDWGIILSYVRSLRGNIVPGHFLRVEAFNAALVVSVLTSVWVQFGWWWTVLAAVPLTVTVLWHGFSMLFIDAVQ